MSRIDPAAGAAATQPLGPSQDAGVQSDVTATTVQSDRVSRKRNPMQLDESARQFFEDSAWQRIQGGDVKQAGGHTQANGRTGADFERHGKAHGRNDIVELKTTPEQAARLANLEHLRTTFEGQPIKYPSQDITLLESAAPDEHGQTHLGARHIGTTMEDDIARLNREPKIPAAGSFFDVASAQFAVDKTIANPANQQFLADFMSDANRTKAALYRVDLGRPVGESLMRSDLASPKMTPSDTAMVVVRKDPTVPPGYRVLTAYPAADRAAQVDEKGQDL